MIIINTTRTTVFIYNLGTHAFPVIDIMSLTNFDLHYDFNPAHPRSMSQSPISIVVMWFSDLHCDLNPALRNDHGVEYDLESRVNLNKLKNQNFYLITTRS